MNYAGFSPGGFWAGGAQFTPWGFGYGGAGFALPGYSVPASGGFTPYGFGGTSPILPPHGGGTYMNAFGMGSGFTVW